MNMLRLNIEDVENGYVVCRIDHNGIESEKYVARDVDELSALVKELARTTKARRLECL